jgi:hypothetical protein
MNKKEESKSVLLISKQCKTVNIKNEEEYNFGTGFIIKKDLHSSYILTCAHVIRELGGIDQLEVDGYSLAINIVSQYSDELMDDLVVLRIDTLLPNPVLPIGILGEIKLDFTTYGWYSYMNGYQEEPICGYLLKPLRMKSRRSITSINGWKFKTNDKDYLKLGLSGSPLMDSRSHIVMSVITNLEGEGFVGESISLDRLEDIWMELPTDLFRKKFYDISKIERFVKLIFHEDKFDKFIDKEFSFILQEPLYFYSKVARYILLCHESNKIDQLLEKLKVNFPVQYLKHMSSKDQEDSIFKIFVFSICTYFRKLISIFKTEEENSESQKSKCEIELVGEDISKFTPEVIDAIIQSISTVLKIPFGSIKFSSIKKGSIKLCLQMPSIALDSLIKLYNEDRSTMQNLGINYLTEILDEPFNIANIRLLLNNGFNREELITICQNNFGLIHNEINLNTEKSEIAEILLRCLREQMQVPYFLNIARDRKPEIFRKFGLYSKAPRRPGLIGQGNNFQQPTRWESISAISLGATVALLGSLVIFIALIAAGDNDPLKGLISFFHIPFGLFVGDIVLNRLGGVNSARAGYLSGTAYLIGSSIVPITLLFILLLLNIVVLWENFRVDNIGSISDFIKDINRWLVVAGSLFFVSGSGLGTYFAYQKAK